MRLVRKYPLSLQKEQVVALPIGAYVLQCREIGDQAFIFAMVSPDAPVVECTVRMFETGEEFQEWSESEPDGFKGDYYGSVIIAGREYHFVREVK